MKKLFLFIVLILTIELKAQEPVENWSSSDYFLTENWHGQFNSVIGTSDGGALATGEFDTEKRFLFLKVDANGNELWRYTAEVPGAQKIAGTEVIELASGQYVGVGYYINSMGFNMGYMIRFSPFGVKLQEVTMSEGTDGYSRLYTVFQSPIGDLLAGGTTYITNGFNHYSPWMLKTDPSFEEEWSINSEGLAGKIISGLTLTYGGKTRHFFVRYADPSHGSMYKLLHTSSYKDNGDIDSYMHSHFDEYGGSITKSAQGFSQVSATETLLVGDIYIRKLMIRKFKYVSGEGYPLVFGDVYGGNGEVWASDGGRQIVETPDGGLAFVATTNSSDLPGYKGKKDMYVGKVNGNTGAVIWQKCFGVVNLDDWGLSIDNTRDGGLIVSGRRRDNRPWLMKLGGTMSTNELNANEISVYPNPVRDLLTINSDKPVEKVEIFNMAGQKMNQVSKIIDNKLNVSVLTPGTYVLKIYINGGKMKTTKFIKK